MDFCSFRAIGAGRIGGNRLFHRGPAAARHHERAAQHDRLPSLQSRRRGARRRQEDDEPADDLDDSTQLVLSMLSLASVVVDDQDEVVVPIPAAYRLGLVRDDTLIEPTLLDAVHKVMKDGSRCSFGLKTPDAGAVHDDERIRCRGCR